MTIASNLQLIKTDAIIPVLTIKRIDTASEVARTLLEDGFHSIEVTLRTDSALDSIRKIKSKFPNIIIGAGTVTNINLFNSALDAGTDFFVSPRLDEILVDNSLRVNQSCVNEKDFLKITSCAYYALDLIQRCRKENHQSA